MAVGCGIYWPEHGHLHAVEAGLKREIWRIINGRFEKSEPSPGEAKTIEGSPDLSNSNSILIMPPIWDHHGHIAWLATQLVQIDFSECKTKGEALLLISGRAKDSPKGAWIVGIGWDHNRWGGGFPDRWELDRITGGIPAYLTRKDGHCAWFNSAALEAAGLSENEPDPPGGSFQRSGGRILGIATDKATERLESVVPRPTPKDLRSGILLALDHLKNCGLAGATDMGLESQPVDVLSQLEQDGELPIRVDGFLNTGALGWAEIAPFSGKSFKVRGGKIFMDGALGSRGGALDSDYSDDPGNRGLLLESEATLDLKLDLILQRGEAAAIHAIGDRALRVALAVVERRKANPPLRFEHLQLLPTKDLQRVRATGAAASLQPCHFLSDEAWASSRLGGRISSAYRLGSVAREGIPILIGTDFPIEKPDPRRNIFAALSREPEGEQLSIDQVFRAMAPPTDMADRLSATFASGEPMLEGTDPRVVLEWKLVAAGRLHQDRADRNHQ